MKTEKNESMHCHPLQPGPMQETGRSLLRLIQNSAMDPIDLLAREAVQNSLDAGQDPDRPVRIDFIAEKRQTDRIASLFPEIAEGLRKRLPGIHTMLQIRDTGTTGLSGTVSGGLENGGAGSLVKLVYEISKPQERKDAGGSWGLGKTVYYRSGCGLVIYYSRTLDRDGRPSSRLAACFIEDESLPGRIMPDAPSGIAWWGGPDVRSADRQWPSALTDDAEIMRILEALAIEPFGPEEFGTAVVIPFLGKSPAPQWEWSHRNDLKRSIQLSILRWYAVRLDPGIYPKMVQRPRLDAYVDGQHVSGTGVTGIFRLIQSLTRSAHSGAEMAAHIQKNPDILLERIALRNRTLSGEPYAGWIAACILPPNAASHSGEMTQESPYGELLGDEDRQSDCPAVGYMRSQGMIVQWNDPEWRRQLKPCKDGKSVLAIFIPDSTSRFTDEFRKKTGHETLEEYLRSLEMADHAGWKDRAGLNIVRRISQNVQNRINRKFFEQEEEKGDERGCRAASRRLAASFLPHGFGWKTTTDPLQNTGQTDPKPDLSGTPSLQGTGIEHHQDGVLIRWLLYWGEKDVPEHVLNIHVATTGASINAEHWNGENGLPGSYPFSVGDFSVSEALEPNGKLAVPNSITLPHGGPDMSSSNGLSATRTDTAVILQNVSGTDFSGRVFRGSIKLLADCGAPGFAPVLVLDPAGRERESQ